MSKDAIIPRDEDWDSLHEQINNAHAPSVVLTILEQIDHYEQETRWLVLSAAFDRLEEMEYSDIENVLLAQCVLRSEHDGYLVRRRLQRWIDDQPQQKRNEIIAHLLTRLESMEAEHVRNIITTLMGIGYRDEILKAKLVVLAQEAQDEETRYSALYALTILGFLQTAFLENRLIDILELLQNVPTKICWCARHLASKKLLPYFKEKFLCFESTDDADFVNGLVNLLYVLADTAEAHPEVASEVWDTILKRNDSRLVRIFATWTGILEKIDDGRIVDFFVHRLEPDREAITNNHVSPHYQSYLRLFNLNLPLQLTAMHRTLEDASEPPRQNAIAALHQDATMDTQNQSSWQTLRSSLKEHCWDIVLRLNIPQTPEWVVEALDETSAFAAGDICRFAGYLRIKESISKLADWIVREDWDLEKGLHITLGLNALSALGNIGAPEAFAALTQSQVSLEARRPNENVLNTTPRDYGTAFSACVQTMQDAEPLIACLEKGSNEHPCCWIGCAAALQDVACDATHLVTPYRERIFALLFREDIVQPDYFYLLVPALGFLEPDDKVAARLLEWVHGAEPLAAVSLEVLARWNRLHLHEDLLCKIGLERSPESAWHRARKMSYQEAFIVGLLFASDPVVFAPTLREIIEDGSYSEIAQVLQHLTSETASSEIVEALVKRAHRVNNGWQAEDDAFWTLCEVAPERFAAEFSHEITKNWYAPAREAIVGGYRLLEAPHSSDTLTLFLVDPVYTVRRSAARALAEKAMDRLQQEVEALCKSDAVRMRQYGIEAAVWLQEEELFRKIHQQAKCDRELNVRTAAREVWTERRRLVLSREYLPLVLETPADALLSTWHYGQALQKLGDDETIWRIDQARSKPDCLPNKRVYLEHLREKIEKGWKDWKEKRERRFVE